MTDMSNLLLGHSEKRDGMAVVWVLDGEKKEFGVCFEGEIFNIARQSVVESIILALTMLGNNLDSLS